jgi:L-lactate dehydrogenase complex protein LldE
MHHVSLFITCTADTLYPSTARAAVQVLESLGVHVHFPSLQTCCGQPWLNSGYPEGARRLARHFLDVFENAEAIVVLSSSCGDTVRNHYAELFTESPAVRERMEAMGRRTFEFCEYLHKVLGLETLPEHPRSRRTTYHSSCRTLRGIGLQGVAERYLVQMFGDDFVTLPASESCCGFGGSFSVKLPEISGRLMADKLHNVVSTGATQVASLDLSCLTHLSSGADRLNLGGLRFVHLAELMAEALEGGKPCL